MSIVKMYGLFTVDIKAPADLLGRTLGIELKVSGRIDVVFKIDRGES